MSKILVHQINGDPLELERSQCVFTDGTRMGVGDCKRKRFYEYEFLGKGVVTTGRGEDLLRGSAVHEGMDMLLQGMETWSAMEAASETYLAGNPWPESMIPEIAETLTKDGLHIVRSLVYAYGARYIDLLMSQYKVISVEEEVNWLMGRFEDGRYLVMMSRCDAALEKIEDGSIWHISHKTSKVFDKLMREKLKVDNQRWREGLSLQARYGKQPAGTLYNYFIKGEKREDRDLKVTRDCSGLVRPYINTRITGDLSPEDISFTYDWEELDPETYTKKTRQVPKHWKRASIYELMDHDTYLTWLDERLVGPMEWDPSQEKLMGRDWLAESVAAIVPEPWVEGEAERWLTGALRQEIDWRLSIEYLQGPPYDGHILDREFPLNDRKCYQYASGSNNLKCQFLDVCFYNIPIERRIEEGRFVERVPNHPQEGE